ncbi:hypothetical protein COOONC_07252 [Cooperia oncophora]
MLSLDVLTGKTREEGCEKASPSEPQDEFNVGDIVSQRDFSLAFRVMRLIHEGLNKCWEKLMDRYGELKFSNEILVFICEREKVPLNEQTNSIHINDVEKSRLEDQHKKIRCDPVGAEMAKPFAEDPSKIGQLRRLRMGTFVHDKKL